MAKRVEELLVYPKAVHGVEAISSLIEHTDIRKDFELRTVGVAAEHAAAFVPVDLLAADFDVVAAVADAEIKLAILAGLNILIVQVFTRKAAYIDVGVTSAQ